MPVERVLVTGAAGFIGSSFVRLLLASDPHRRVWSLDRLHGVGGTWRNLDGIGAERHELVRGDVCDRRLVADLVEGAGIDTIVHFAAESHVDRSIAGPQAFVRTNVLGTSTLLEAARWSWLGPGRGDGAGRRFHQVSTDEVFGDRGTDDNVADESSLRRPSSPYAASKVAADELVRSWRTTYGLPISITYSSNNLGPRQHPEKLVPLVILRALAGEAIPIYGDGLPVRRWLHVDDHCEAVLAVLLADTEGRDYAVGPQQGTTNLDLVRRLCAVLDRRRPEGAPHLRHLRHVDDRPGHDRVYHSSAGRIARELGWRPRIPLDRALEHTVDWYLDNMDWVRAAVASPRWRSWLDRWYGSAVGEPTR